MKDAAMEELEEVSATKPVSAPTEGTQRAKTLVERSEDWQKNADEVVEAALLSAPTSILSVELHPFTAARGSLLRRAKNEFIAGVSFRDIADPFLSIGKFLLLMSLPLADARKVVADEDALEDKAYQLLEGIKLSDIEQVVAMINSYVEKEMSTQVKGELPDDQKKATENAPKN